MLHVGVKAFKFQTVLEQGKVHGRERRCPKRKRNEIKNIPPLDMMTKVYPQNIKL